MNARAGLFSVVTASALALSALGCSKSEDASEAAATSAEQETQATTKRSNIERVQLTVPYGKQVACTDIFDLTTMATAIGDVIGEMKDHGPKTRDVSFSCAFHRAGEAPKDAEQQRKFKENMKLGVLPGDEYCMVNGYCSSGTDAAGFKASCEAKGDTINTTLGIEACVHTSQRGADYAYTYRVLDADSKCVLEVLGGPSVTDETLVQKCTRGVLEDVVAADLKNFR